MPRLSADVVVVVVVDLINVGFTEVVPTSVNQICRGEEEETIAIAG